MGLSNEEDLERIVLPNCVGVSDFNRLKRLCSKLIQDLRFRIEDRANSSLPEWEKEAESLGVILDLL
jgi:hypothetical protein